MIGIFGGAFDPPHVGHLMSVSVALAIGDLETVVVVPTANHPLKKVNTLFRHRYAMCQLTFKQPNMIVSDVEHRIILGREAAGVFGKPVYTLETVEALMQEMPAAEFRLIVGVDEAQRFDQWYRIDELLKLAPPIILPRYEKVSSTKLRNHLKNGTGRTEVRKFMVPKVLDYIAEYELYRR